MRVVVVVSIARHREGDAMIKVMLVAEHTLLREGLRRILEEDADMEVVAQAADGSQAAEKASKLEPDIIVVDLTPPGVDGLEVIKRFHDLAPGSRIVALGATAQAHDPRRLFRAGALGHVLKNATSRELVAAIRTVHDGRQYIAEELKAASELERTGEAPPGNVLGVLTDRQIQVTRQLAAGRTNREIAAVLGLSVKTVDAHRSNILAKLGMRNNAELTRFAIENQLLEVG
jgi:DNA-binding NarL/FixJ family response regulator